MILLDIRTLAAVMGLVLISATFLSFLFYRQHKTMKGTGDWALGFGLLSIGITLLFFRGYLPPFLSVLLANLVLLSGSAFLHHGICRFVGRPTPRLFYAAIFGTCWLPYIFIFNDATYLNIRIYMSNFGHGALYLMMAVMLFRYWRHHKRGTSIVVAGFAFVIFLMAALRSVSIALSGDQPVALMQSGAPTYIYYSSLVVGFIGLVVGLIMLVSETLRDELQEAIATERRLKQEQNNFWAMISHEFRTPLGTISASSQLIDISNSPRSAVIEDESDRIRRAALRLSRLVDRCLVHDWMNEAAQSLNEVEFSLRKMLADLAFEYGIAFEAPGNQDLHIKGDEYLLSTAVSSLIDNAIRYGKTKEATILRCIAETDNRLRIEVEDDGPGVPLEDIDKVFEKYYRSGNRKNESGGGLGLYTAKEILARHGATLRLDQQIRTIFSAVFPLERRVFI